MYQQVNTTHVFHCEDDWCFDSVIDFEPLFNVLNQNAWISGICMRKENDFTLSAKEQNSVKYETLNGLDFFRLDGLHAQWHGYTFNPHLASIELWKKYYPFHRFKKERHISRTMRKDGLVMLYQCNGGSSHLGDNASVSSPARKKYWFF